MNLKAGNIENDVEVRYTEIDTVRCVITTQYCECDKNDFEVRYDRKNI